MIRGQMAEDRRQRTDEKYYKAQLCLQSYKFFGVAKSLGMLEISVFSAAMTVVIMESICISTMMT